MTPKTLTLDGLDGVPWKWLRHAYGKAKDTPGQLQALLDSDPETRERALWALEDALCHQGYQVNEASIAAIPFLFQLLAWSEMQQRRELLDLLVCIAHGHGWFQGHSELPVTGLVFDRPTIDSRLDEERKLQHQIAAAITARQVEIAALLDDPDGDIATGAMCLVGCLSRPEPVLQAALDRSLPEAGRRSRDLRVGRGSDR